MAAVVQGPAETLSEYADGLEGNVKNRYLQKVKLCLGIDPYTLKKKDCETDFAKFPQVEFPDISNYLVLQTSFYTAKQMKAWKSMEAYNFFVCGWLKDLAIKPLDNKCSIVFARVNHSQRSTETPLKTWVLVKDDGEVITAHCNCMAGLAESCSHVGAVLYAVETGVRMKESITCTMEKSKWLMPSHIKKIPVAPIAQIDFSSARAKKQKLDDAIAGTTPDRIKAKPLTCPQVRPGSTVYREFFQALNRNCPKSAALMIKEDYYKKFVPKSATTALPKPILDHRTQNTINMTSNDLDKLCQEFKISELTPAHIKAVERETRKQANSRIWFRQRAGRITASKLRPALHTNVEKPARSLIKAICYPESHRFSTTATRYGCKHEAVARKDYETMMRANHDNFSVADSGLCLNAKWPYMGASPDGIIVCSCHGTGVCEIKCPHCHQDKENIAASAGEKGFCLVKDGDDIKLDRNHTYYYQVQAQLHILEADYCDFIVWNRNDFFVERIVPDIEFWDSIVPRAEKFFRECILPEVFAMKFTKQAAASLNVSCSRSP